MRIGSHTNFIVIHLEATSLYSLIADGQYRAISLGRDKWKSLIGADASLQLNCNKEGFNSQGYPMHFKVRIGIIGNEHLIAKVLIPVSVLVQEAALKNPSRVATWQVMDQIMETDILRQWDISWYSDKETSTVTS